MKITFFPFSIHPSKRKRRGMLLASSAFVLGSLLSGYEAEAGIQLPLQSPARITHQSGQGGSHRATTGNSYQNITNGNLRLQGAAGQGFQNSHQLGRPSMFGDSNPPKQLTHNQSSNGFSGQSVQGRGGLGQFQPTGTIPTGGSFQRATKAPSARIATKPVNHSVPASPMDNKVTNYRLKNVGSAGFISGISVTLGSSLKGRMVNANLAEIDLPARVLPAMPAAFGGTGKESVEKATMRIDRTFETVQIFGSASQVDAWTKVVQNIDHAEYQSGVRRVIYLGNKNRRKVLQFLNGKDVLASRNPGGFQHNLLAANGRQNAGQFPGLASQTAYRQENRRGQQENKVQRPNQLPANNGGNQTRGMTQQEGMPDFLQNLDVRFDPASNSLIVVGPEGDIKQFQDLLNQISKQALANAPGSQVILLKFANSQVVASEVQQLYDQAYSSRAQFGAASIKAIQQQNSVVISGSKNALDVLEKLIKELDVEAPVEGTFKVFRLRYASSTDVSRRIAGFFRTIPVLPGATNQNNAGGGGANQVVGDGVIVIPDPRANIVIFKGSKIQIATAEKLVEQIDVIDIKSEKRVKIIPLRNSDADTMATVLRNALTGAVGGGEQNEQLQSTAQQGGGFGGGQGGQGGNNVNDPSVAPSLLKLSTVDPKTGEVKSGILADVSIVPDPIGNTLVITAPEESLPLIEMLVKQLDRLPNAETQIKVFTVSNGDATQIFTMMQELFLQSQTQQGGGFGGQQSSNNGLDRLPLQSGVSDQSLVNLRFAIEPRTNSIVASGSQGDLTVVEDLITHLDRDITQQYSSRIIRLSNVPAADTAQTLQAWADGRLTLIQGDPTTPGGTTSAARKNVVIQQDDVQNHLLIVASPRDLAEIEQMVQVLDRRPNMVAIEVMIAEVRLDDTDEFGLEYGVQDSLLFDRGIGSGIGFNFNQGAIGNDLTPGGLATREAFGGQGLVNLNVGRINSNLGYGGLVLSAGNESVSVLMRALQDKQRVKILSRPQIMALDLLQSRIQVGQRVPFLDSINNTVSGGVQNGIVFQDVGIILEVVPRISPDGVITMLVNTTNSSLGDQAAGIVVSTDANGNAIRQPIINTTEAISTVIARSGQTVVLGGLIRESKTNVKRGIPILSDLPRLGNLFSFQSEVESRSELMIFMTPRIIDSDDALTEWNQTEMERMNWCTQDVLNLSNIGYSNQGRFDTTSGPVTVYPSMDPTGQGSYPNVAPLEVQGGMGGTDSQYSVSPTSLQTPARHSQIQRPSELPAAKPKPDRPSLISRTFQEVFRPGSTKKYNQSSNSQSSGSSETDK